MSRLLDLAPRVREKLRSQEMGYPVVRDWQRQQWSRLMPHDHILSTGKSSFSLAIGPTSDKINNVTTVGKGAWWSYLPGGYGYSTRKGSRMTNIKRRWKREICESDFDEEKMKGKKQDIWRELLTLTSSEYVCRRLVTTSDFRKCMQQ